MRFSDGYGLDLPDRVPVWSARSAGTLGNRLVCGWLTERSCHFVENAFFIRSPRIKRFLPGPFPA